MFVCRMRGVVSRSPCLSIVLISLPGVCMAAWGWVGLASFVAIVCFCFSSFLTKSPSTSVEPHSGDGCLSGGSCLGPPARPWLSLKAVPLRAVVRLLLLLGHVALLNGQAVWSHCVEITARAVPHKMSIPLTLMALRGPSRFLDLLLSAEGERPLLCSTVLSALLFLEMSLGTGGDTSLSTLLTCCGPGVGERCFGSLLYRNLGPTLAKILSVIRAASASDPSSSGNRVWVWPLTLPSMTGLLAFDGLQRPHNVHHVLYPPDSHGGDLNSEFVAVLSNPFRNWSATISTLANGSSRGHAISANFCNAST